jgi:MFS family permease
MSNRHDQILFWGCFIALITTSYAFISRIIMCTGAQFATDFGLDKVSVGELVGADIWPFGMSIIIFSLFIDRIGYKVAMIFSFASYLIYTAFAFAAYNSIHGVTGDALVAAQKHGYQLLYWGSIILVLGNGSVEAYINPIVTTMFNTDKTKWLNRLHAGWPGGLVLGGLCTIALVGFGLVFAQLGQVFNWSSNLVWRLTGGVVLIFSFVTKSFGRLILAVLIIIMMPQATTELGTDGWITSLMQTPMQAAGHNPAWVLVYTSAIMMILRFCAGPLIHKLSPPGLLATCSALAALGLFALSKTAGAGMFTIFPASTLYGVGKTFFWPTILGLTSEQCPRGGALTLNAMGGIGMLAVGILGAPFIGYLQESSAMKQLAVANPALYQTVTVEKNYLLGKYQAIDPVKSAAVTNPASTDTINAATITGQFSALGKMALFPIYGLICYLALILHFKSKDGYRPVQLGSICRVNHE